MPAASCCCPWLQSLHAGSAGRGAVWGADGRCRPAAASRARVRVPPPLPNAARSACPTACTLIHIRQSSPRPSPQAHFSRMLARLISAVVRALAALASRAASRRAALAPSPLSLMAGSTSSRACGMRWPNKGEWGVIGGEVCCWPILCGRAEVAGGSYCRRVLPVRRNGRATLPFYPLGLEPPSVDLGTSQDYTMYWFPIPPHAA